MWFRTKEERQQHKIAGPIPDLIWQDFFEPEISSTQQISLNSSLSDLEAIKLEGMALRERQSFWFIFSIHFGHLRFSSLIEKARQLDINDADLFILSLYLKEDDLAYYLLENLSLENLEYLFKHQNFNLFLLLLKMVN